MSPFKQALGNAKLAVLTLFIALIFSFVLNIVLAILLYRVPTNMTVHQSSTNPSYAVGIKANSINNAQVYQL